MWVSKMSQFLEAGGKNDPSTAVRPLNDVESDKEMEEEGREVKTKI